MFAYLQRLPSEDRRWEKVTDSIFERLKVDVIIKFRNTAVLHPAPEHINNLEAKR